MRPRDRLLALVVVVIWGVNFPATRLALDHFPPFLLGALRYLLLALPAIVLVPRPQTSWKWIIGAGLGIGTAQFAFLYLAMSTGMPPGLASIVLQASAPFTVLLAALLLGERRSPAALAGVGVAISGLVVIGWYRAQVADVLPVLLTVLGGLGWACGNLCMRQARGANPLHMTMWLSVVPPIPLGLLSLSLDGPDRIRHAFGTAFTASALPAVGGLLYVVLLASVVGYGVWALLMGRYPSSQIAPWSMLVPVVGVLSSWAAFGERPALAEVFGGLLVVGGILYSSRRP